MKRMTRATAAIIALLMLISMLPAAALASDESAAEGPAALTAELPAEEYAEAEADPAEEPGLPEEGSPAELPEEASDPEEASQPVELSEPEQASDLPPAEEPSASGDAEAPAGSGELPAEAVTPETEPDTASPEPENDPPSEEPASAQPEPLQDGDSFPSDLYIKQAQSGWCTLASATMMVRAKFYLGGNDSWKSITQNSVYSSAWLPGSGLYFSWTYYYGSSYVTVSHSTVNGMSTSTLKSILDKHPEGIVFYLYDYPHAIFVHDYSYDSSGSIVFYGSDTVSGYVGYRSIGSTWLGKQYGGQSALLSRVDAYWYISSSNIKTTSYYTVTFDANAKDATCSTKTKSGIAGGSKIGDLPVPVRKGYFFAGWYTASSGGDLVTSSTTISKNMTLYAHWQAPNGTISFSKSPAAIYLKDGETSTTVTATGTGNINDVTFDVTLEDRAAGKVTRTGTGKGKSITVTFTADPSASGTYYATFTMYDAETHTKIASQTLAINVINEDIYLETYSSLLVFAAGSSAIETVDIFYGGTEGDLPEGYEVNVTADNSRVRTLLGAWKNGSRPLYVSVDPTAQIYNSVEAVVTIQLVDPGKAVCSEAEIAVSIRPTSGVCGGTYDDSVRWTYSSGRLTIYADPQLPDIYSMWNYETVDGRAPWYCWADEIMQVVIGDGVTRIGTCAFYGCSLLSSVVIPDSVTVIGEKAFWGCSSLGSFSAVEIPGSVTEIQKDVFRGCSELTTLKLNEGTQKIAAGALTGCTSLNTLYLPFSVRDVQLSAVKALQDIWFAGTRAQWNDLDAACSISSMLSAGTRIHYGVGSTVYEAAKILSDATGIEDDKTDVLLAVQILQDAAGL